MSQSCVQISHEEMKLKVNSKKLLWEALRRNGIYVPDFKCKCININYLENVKNQIYWAPPYKFLSIRPCPTPPKKSVIFNEIMKACRNSDPLVNLGIKDEHGATTEYFLHLLSTIDAQHPFFSKGYLPSAEDSKFSRPNKEAIRYDNSNGFFDGLPVYPRHARASSGHRPRIPIKRCQP